MLMVMSPKSIAAQAPRIADLARLATRGQLRTVAHPSELPFERQLGFESCRIF